MKEGVRVLTAPEAVIAHVVGIKEEVVAAPEAAARRRRRTGSRQEGQEGRRSRARRQRRRKGQEEIAGIMFLVAGLGNPGEKYAATPHNLGFLVVDRLAARHSHPPVAPGMPGPRRPGNHSGGKTVMLAQPQTFMNLSGVAIKPLLEKNELGPADLILIYDELDLPWGTLRLKPKGSAAGHNGAADVIEKLGTQEFPRIRMGVHPGHPIASGVDYLLSAFNRQQKESLDAFIDLGADAAESIIAEGVEKSMTEIQSSRPGLKHRGKMRIYENLFIVKPDATEEEVDASGRTPCRKT